MRNGGFGFFFFEFLFLLTPHWQAGRPLTVLPGASVSAPSPSDLGAAHIFLQRKISALPLPSREPGLLSGRCRRWGLLALDL